MTFEKAFTTALIISIIIFQGCRDSNLVTEGDMMISRSLDQELEYVKARALSFNQNFSGHWEAEFENGVVMIYVPQGSFTIGNDNLEGAGPEHKVNLSHYWVSKTPITIGQFRAFVKETEYKTQVEESGHEGPWVYDFSERVFITKPGYHWDNAFKDVIAKFSEITIDDRHPVNNVSWNDGIAYFNWLAEKTGLQFTLPTEAEWEYAARGNDGRIYPWCSEDLDGTQANYAEEEFNKYFPGTGQSIVHFGVNDGYAITSPVGSYPNGASPVGALDMAGNLTEWVYDSRYS